MHHFKKYIKLFYFQLFFFKIVGDTMIILLFVRVCSIFQFRNFIYYPLVDRFGKIIMQASKLCTCGIRVLLGNRTQRGETSTRSVNYALYQCLSLSSISGEKMYLWPTQNSISQRKYFLFTQSKCSRTYKFKLRLP